MADRPIHAPRGALVYLRPVEPDDAEVLHAWYADDRFRTTMGSPPQSLARWRRRIDDSMANPDDEIFRFMICRIGDDVPVGRADIFFIDRQNGSCGFGIGLGGATDRGQGLGTDAVGAIVDFAFGELRMERVWLDTDVTNTRAQAAYRKAGFTLEGTLRRAWFIDGSYVDGVRMSMLADEWRALSRPRSWDHAAEASAGD